MGLAKSTPLLAGFLPLLKVEDWKVALASWAIPEEILKQAPTSPWIHPVELFQLDPNQKLEVTPSTKAALVGLKEEKSVLDIGCGGGKATFELLPEVKKAIGVDHQAVMLERYEDYAKLHNLEVQTFFGDWPGIEDQVPVAEVALAHHVIYNVSEIEAFINAISSHASSRVVLELPLYHPLTSMNPYWKHFWNLDRPSAPTAHDAHQIIKDMGFDAKIDFFDAPPFKEIAIDKMVEFNRIRLCLPESKDAEILEFTKAQPTEVRKLATIWWDI
jgi:SAM-dependent methyltransferase